MSEPSPIRVVMEVRILLTQPAPALIPQEIKVFDGVEFELPNFDDCKQIALRFHALAATIKAEQAQVKP